MKKTKYELIYDEVDKILGEPIFVLGKLIGYERNVTDESLEALNEYAKTFIRDDADKGELRTILINIKPHKNNPIVSETAETLADMLRTKSKRNRI